jgi:hypothetical protein
MSGERKKSRPDDDENSPQGDEASKGGTSPECHCDYGRGQRDQNVDGGMIDDEYDCKG